MAPFTGTRANGAIVFSRSLFPEQKEHSDGNPYIFFAVVAEPTGLFTPC